MLLVHAKTRPQLTVTSNHTLARLPGPQIAAGLGISYSRRVAKPDFIELPGEPPIPILYEDRSVLVIDKPRHWMLVPFSWQRTNRNLQAALFSSIAAGDFWARSRSLKFLRYVHRLDAETTGLLMFAKSQGAVDALASLFENRRIEKTYLAVVAGAPVQAEWTCYKKLGPDPRHVGRQRVDERHGKTAETHFRVLQTVASPQLRQAAGAETRPGRFSLPKNPRPQQASVSKQTLVEARPATGRTHQIRIHLAAAGTPCVGDQLYGRPRTGAELGLRAIRLAYRDPFTRRQVEIAAPLQEFCREYGFDIPAP